MTQFADGKLKWQNRCLRHPRKQGEVRWESERTDEDPFAPTGDRGLISILAKLW